MRLKGVRELIFLCGCVPFVQAVASQAYTYTNVKVDGYGAVHSLLSPPTGPPLLSGGDNVGGYTHTSLSVAPSVPFTDPNWNTTLSFDYAGNNPSIIVRHGYTNLSPPLARQISISRDSGATWTEHPNAYQGNWMQGTVAVSSDGETIFWLLADSTCLASYQQNLFGRSYNCFGGVMASDKKNATVFYNAAGNKFSISTFRAVIFTPTTGTLGASTKPVQIVVHPQVQGDVWVSTDTGLYHTTNSGDSFTTINGFMQAWALSLGAPAKAGGYPTVFAAATYQGVTGLFRSDDQGVSWAQINASYNFGDVTGVVLTADLRKYGRVYLGVGGKIVYGDIA